MNVDKSPLGDLGAANEHHFLKRLSVHQALTTIDYHYICLHAEYC